MESKMSKWKNYDKEKPKKDELAIKRYLIASEFGGWLNYDVAFYDKKRGFWVFDMDEFSLNEKNWRRINNVKFWVEIEPPKLNNKKKV